MKVECVESKRCDDMLNLVLLASGIGISDSEMIPVGHATIMICDWMRFLCNFEIAEQFRGCGLGTKFMEIFIDKYGVNCLSVNVNNARAIHLYDKFGFNGEDILDEEKKCNDEYIKEQSYLKSLDDMTELDKIMLFDKILDICNREYKYIYKNQYNADKADTLRCFEISNY